jgi:hypothetical protein
MKKRCLTGMWMTTAFCSALCLASVVVIETGTDVVGINRALQVTARFSFLPFWLAYAGGALTKLCGSNFRAVARHGREFGLAFASAHLIHVALVVWLYRVSPRPPVSGATFAFFAIGLLWTYLLALFSLRRLRQMLSSGWWRILRVAGMEYISFAFLTDFVHPIEWNAKSLLGYLPFMILSVTGTSLRLAAWISRDMGPIRHPGDPEALARGTVPHR